MSPPRLRPRLESLEGRMLLTAANAPITTSLVALNFTVPGTTTEYRIGGPASFTGVVHAVASQQASSVTLTLKTGAPYRPRESVQVEVVTGPITNPATPVPSATPGVQYQPIHQTVTFPPGVRSLPVTIPIVASAANPGLLSFKVTATQLGVTFGSFGSDPATEDVFLAKNINALGPRIDGAYLVVSGHRTSDFVLHFSQPMDPASVQNVNAYDLMDSTTHAQSTPLFGPWGGFGFRSTPVVLKKATYDPSTNTVDLHLAQSVDARDAIQISQKTYWSRRSQSFDLNTSLLRDAAGTPINEDGSGFGGGFLITLTNKKATIFDGVTQSVISSSPPRK